MSTHISTPENYFCKLNNLGAIQLVGEQADSYLQGQVSVNMELLTPSHSLLACHCDFKGKMWNANYLVRHKTTINFLITKSALPACLTELKKYGVFSKVEITDISESKVFLGMAGKIAKAQLQLQFPELTDVHQSIVSNDNGWVLTINRNSNVRYLCALDSDTNDIDKIIGDITEQPESLWSSLDVTDGVAPVFETTSNEFVPQMFNMQALGAIDFNKGCYMGQEVVARTKYLGKNKRATYLMTAEIGKSNESISASPGNLLEKSVGENWRRGGTIVHASQFQGVLYVLAVLSNDSNTGDVLRLKETPNVSLTVARLPYSIEEEVNEK